MIGCSSLSAFYPKRQFWLNSNCINRLSPSYTPVWILLLYMYYTHRRILSTASPNTLMPSNNFLLFCCLVHSTCAICFLFSLISPENKNKQTFKTFFSFFFLNNLHTSILIEVITESDWWRYESPSWRASREMIYSRASRALKLNNRKDTARDKFVRVDAGGGGSCAVEAKVLIKFWTWYIYRGEKRWCSTEW